MHCRVRWEEDLAALVPVPSSGAGPVAEQCVLNLHVSSSTWAVSSSSVSSILKGTEMALHDLVNLSCDYLLNTTNKQKKVSVAAPLTCSVCSSCPLWWQRWDPLLDVYLIA